MNFILENKAKYREDFYSDAFLVDDFILLVQKEMIDSIIDIAKSNLSPGIQNSFDETKIRIADSWLKNILHLNI